MPYISKGTPSTIHKAKLHRKPSGLQSNYNNAWAKVSINYRKAHPLCECCLHLGTMTDITAGGYKGCVDHMIPITRNGSMYNLDNLLALCKGCHDTKSQFESKGIAPVPTRLDMDGKVVPYDRQDVIKWLADKVKIKLQWAEQSKSTGA